MAGESGLCYNEIIIRQKNRVRYMEEERRIGILLKMVNNIYKRNVNNKIAEINLTTAQCDVLGFLHENEGHEVNPMDVERKFNLTRPTVTGLLKRLEEKEFIRLESSYKDHRYKQIILTEKADKHHQEMLSNLKEVEEQLYKDVSEEEKEVLVGILNKMLRNMSVQLNGEKK